MPEEFKDKKPKVMRTRHNLNVENIPPGNPCSMEQQNTEQAGMYKIIPIKNQIAAIIHGQQNMLATVAAWSASKVSSSFTR